MKTVFLFVLMIGCAKPAEDSGVSGAPNAVPDETETLEVPNDDVDSGDQGSDSADDSVCSEDYSLCGNIEVPADFEGSTRSLAVVLYSSVPPAGPPDGIIVEIDDPDLRAGENYPIRVLPALFNGEYHVWVNLYMEDGGEWMPVNGIDYTGSTATPLSFDGSAVTFDDISLELATGW
jgi:hypothetical protein